MSVSVDRLRNISALIRCQSCSQFVGRSEHTCGPKAQRSVDSCGIQTHNLHNTCVLEGRHSNQLSQPLLLRHLLLVIDNFILANLLIASWTKDKKRHVCEAQNLQMTLAKEFYS